MLRTPHRSLRLVAFAVVAAIATGACGDRNPTPRPSPSGPQRSGPSIRSGRRRDRPGGRRGHPGPAGRRGRGRRRQQPPVRARPGRPDLADPGRPAGRGGILRQRRPDELRWRAGPARAGLPSRLPGRPPVLRLLHGFVCQPGPRRLPRVGRRGQGRHEQRRDPVDHGGLCGQPQRRRADVRTGRVPLCGNRRRRRRGRPARVGTEPEHVPRQDPPPRRRRAAVRAAVRESRRTTRSWTGTARCPRSG